MRSLSLDQLRTLTEVVAQGSFSAAARRLNLTQPAVSLQIRELERRFGVQLIERLGKQAYPTPPGRTLVEAADAIFRECESAEVAMRRFRDGWLGRVRLGCTYTALMYSLPPILRWLRTRHPNIELLVVNMPTRDAVERILENTLDLALVTLPIQTRQLRITPLRPETLMAIFPADTPDVPDVVTPAYVAQQVLLMEHGRGQVHALIQRWLSGKMPVSPMQLGTVDALKTAVASRLGMSIVPNIAVAKPDSRLIVRPLQPAVPSTLALIEHVNKPDDPALAIVRDALMTLRAGFEPEPPPAARKAGPKVAKLRAGAGQSSVSKKRAGCAG